MNKILFKNLIPTPWKNGQGTTYQLDIYPANSSIAENNFDYRISFAEINGQNNFSKFLNYQRYLTVVLGDGIKFNQEELLQNQIILFNGDLDVESDILNSISVLDLGVIFNPQKVSAEMFLIKGNIIYQTHHEITYFVSTKINEPNEIHIFKNTIDKEMIILNDKYDYFVIGINMRK